MRKPPLLAQRAREKWGTRPIRTFAEDESPGRMRPGPHESLIFERDYGAAVAAEGGNFLQAAVGERDGHHRAVAVDGVTVGGKVPASILGVLHGLGRWAGAWASAALVGLPANLTTRLGSEPSLFYPDFLTTAYPQLLLIHRTKTARLIALLDRNQSTAIVGQVGRRPGTASGTAASLFCA